MKALQVSEYVVSKCYEYNRPISNLKLQKILYFLYGYFYKKFGCTLFDDDFVAWKLGPVVLDVYFNYYNNIANPICESSDVKLDLKTNEISFVDEKIQELNELSTWDLVEKSHKTTPWKEVYKNGEGKGDIIKSYKICDFFEDMR